LIGGLQDVEPLVRGACAWALGEIGTSAALEALAARAAVEGDAQVVEEINAARLGGSAPQAAG
jgi:epoxyqueuosine reductase